MSVITLAALQARIAANPDLVLVEALPAKYYAHSHLPGAINIAHDEVDELAPTLLPDREAEIVVYCADGPCPNSGLAAARLAELGYADVADYSEGKAEWIAAGLPVEGRSRAAA
ncbi:MAG: rhodanese-like domain-containing protein [Gaiellaceae bacterium]